MESSDDDPLPIWAHFVILIILTFFNGFFSLAEISTLHCNKMKMQKMADKKNKTAKLVLKLIGKETRFLSVVQIGVTLAGFLASGLAAANFSDKLGERFNLWLNITWGSTLSFILITFLLSYITLVLGELFPKRIGLRFPNSCALISAWPIAIFKVLFMPLVWLLSSTTELLVFITRLEKIKKQEELPEEEILNILSSGTESGKMPEEEQKMIAGIFKLDNLNARDVLTPRVDVFMLEVDDDLYAFSKNSDFRRFTRIPIYKETKDNIIGILNIKDLIGKDVLNLHIGSVMRKPFFVTDALKVNELYKMMQVEKTHIAIVNDEFGGFEGIVTMEDIIEEVLGNITDEYDVEEKDIELISEKKYKVLGSTPIQDINRELGLEFSEDDPSYDTISGYIISTFEEIPAVGKTFIPYPECKITIKRVDVKQIQEIEIELIDDEEERKKDERK